MEEFNSLVQLDKLFSKSLVLIALDNKSLGARTRGYSCWWMILPRKMRPSTVILWIINPCSQTLTKMKNLHNIIYYHSATYMYVRHVEVFCNYYFSSTKSYCCVLLSPSIQEQLLNHQIFLLLGKKLEPSCFYNKVYSMKNAIFLIIRISVLSAALVWAWATWVVDFLAAAMLTDNTLSNKWVIGFDAGVIFPMTL